MGDLSLLLPFSFLSYVPSPSLSSRPSCRRRRRIEYDDIPPSASPFPSPLFSFDSPLSQRDIEGAGSRPMEGLASHSFSPFFFAALSPGMPPPAMRLRIFMAFPLPSPFFFLSFSSLSSGRARRQMRQIRRDSRSAADLFLFPFFFFL